MTYYSIQQVSEMTQIPATTLRYYDKRGLLFPFWAQRNRLPGFQKKRPGFLQIIPVPEKRQPVHCEIRQFFQWVRKEIHPERTPDLFLKRREVSAKWPNCKDPGRHQLQM